MYSFHYFEQFENKYHEINFLFAENFFFIKIDNFRKEREIHINISHLRSQKVTLNSRYCRRPRNVNTLKIL